MKVDNEFDYIVKDIVNNTKFKKMKNEVHHGMNRMDHSLNVAKLTYKFAKRINMKNYVLLTRAALMHDLFLNEELVGKINLVSHPLVAAQNARKEFNISDLEFSIIKSHMFPLTTSIPKNKESWVLTTTDKIVALFECIKYKIPLRAVATYLLILNFIVI